MLFAPRSRVPESSGRLHWLDFTVKHHPSLSRWLLAIPYIVIAGLLTACPPKFPLQITAIAAAPDPVVGQVVTLEVEVRSTRDEADVTILIQPPEGVLLIDGDLEWHGSLRAGDAYRHTVSLCAIYPGDWAIHATASSRFGPDDTYGDSETIHFISTSETGEAVPGSQYRIIQGSPVPVLTPSPVPTPATCS